MRFTYYLYKHNSNEYRCQYTYVIAREVATKEKPSQTNKDE